MSSVVQPAKTQNGIRGPPQSKSQPPTGGPTSVPSDMPAIAMPSAGPSAPPGTRPLAKPGPRSRTPRRPAPCTARADKEHGMAVGRSEEDETQ